MRQAGAKKRTIGSLVVAVMMATSLAGSGGVAHAGQRENHCIAPDGTDLNELLGTTDAIVLPFCTEVHTGDWWWPLVRVSFAPTHEHIPPGYVPTGATPREDFLSKLEAVRYVVDAGTKRERTYVFFVEDLQMFAGEDWTPFLTWVVPMHPLPPGEHTVDTYVTLTADNWDGLGLDEGVNRIPGGESSSGSREFVVISGAD